MPAEIVRCPIGRDADRPESGPTHGPSYRSNESGLTSPFSRCAGGGEPAILFKGCRFEAPVVPRSQRLADRLFCE